MASGSDLRIGIDIGGTFTDFVVFRPESRALETFKILSTPDDPSEAVLEGLEWLQHLFTGKQVSINHGSTVATNALLERKGAKTALVTTQGFRDVLQIGRQNRPALYDFSVDPPESLVPSSLRFEVEERVEHDGTVSIPLDPSRVESLIEQIPDSVESVAVCLIFSFLHPEHEAQIARRLQQAGFFVSASSEILPEYREYERFSTTVINAYVSPVLDRYLAHLQSAFPQEGSSQVQLRVMQSNGGNISIAEARRAGARCILSGPAGGIVGARHIGRIANPGIQPDRLRLITFDMGGTSTDVSLIAGEPQLTVESVIGGYPIRVPMLDIHTIGAGGGSIASRDLGGALRVGPESAGAFPGPACYGRVALSESLPTVTDANLVLGRLAPEYFLGGEMRLDVNSANAVFARLGEDLGMSPVQASLGAIEVANAHMERALRVISVERGYDPQDFTLISFGGAGGLHAADLARRLGIPQVLVPPLASTLSAYGMLVADVIKDYTRTIMLPGDTPPERIQLALDPLLEQAMSDLISEGIPRENIRLEPQLDVRYLGQSYELTIPFAGPVAVGFHQAHERQYGYSRPDAQLEIVNVRVRGTGLIEPPPLEAKLPSGSLPELLDYRRVNLGPVEKSVPFYNGENLRPGGRFDGPGVILRADTTIFVGPSDRYSIDEHQNILITVGG